MPRKALTTKEFIEKAKQIHGDTYNYNEVNYVNAHTKIQIICRDHGSFRTQPRKHLEGSGCPVCAINRKRITKEEFIRRSIEVHGDRYIYDQVEWVDTKTKVTITCPEHGDFKQLPSDHMKGIKCRECGYYERTYPNQLDTDLFKERASIIHRGYYNYNKVEYGSSKDKVTILCPIHGEFYQRPSNHLRGDGCPYCNKGAYNPKVAERHKDKWLNTKAYVYLIKLYSDEESFYKVGITTNFKKRFDKSKMPYNVRELFIKETNKYNATYLEHHIIKYVTTEGLSYSPSIKFDGHSECFKVDKELDKAFLFDLLN